MLLLSFTFINFRIRISERVKIETLVYSKLEYCCSLIFKRVRKIPKSDLTSLYVCPSVRPSVRMEQLVSHWTDFHEV